MGNLADLVLIAAQLPGLLMVVFRIGGIMIMAPFFGSSAIPAKVKICLTLVLALALWPVVPHKILLPATLPVIVVGVVSELLIGLAIGLAVSIIFAGLNLAGLTIGQQMGIALADVFNPAFDDNSDVVGVLYYWIGLMIFLSIGGHRMLIGSLVDSFRAVPLGGFAVSGQLLGLLTGMMAASFVMAFKVAVPVVLALFMASVAMGLINRTVPQLNILTAGFAIRTSLGMLMAAATVLAGMRLFGGTLEHALGTLNAMIGNWTATPAG